MQAIVALAVCAMWMRSYTVADTLSLQTVQRFADHPLGVVDENVAYSISSDAGTIVMSRRRGTFGLPLSETQLLPKRPGETRCVWSTTQPTQPGAGRLHGFGSERVKWVHAGNLDAVDAWSFPMCWPLVIVPF